MTLLFFGTDLNARTRLQRAASSKGLEVVMRHEVQPESSVPDLVVVDLDWAQPMLVGSISKTFSGVPVLGYYSHVEDETRSMARGLGIEAFPRSRFWREASALIDKALL